MSCVCDGPVCVCAPLDPVDPAAGVIARGCSVMAGGRVVRIGVRGLRGRSQALEAAEQDIENALGGGRAARQRKDQRGACERAANLLKT